MLVIALTTIALCAVAVCALARTAGAVMDRLGLDLMTVLLWLGLAERPSGPQPPRARHRASIDRPSRGRLRSPHGAFARSTARRSR